MVLLALWSTLLVYDSIVFMFRYEYKGTAARPLSTIDSGLYSTDSTDSEQDNRVLPGRKTLIYFFIYLS